MIHLHQNMPDIFFVGLRWPQHAMVSGYDAIVKSLGQWVEIPISDRHPWKDTSDVRTENSHEYWHIEKISQILELIFKPTYSLPILRMELAVAWHMLFRRGAIYHVLYGEMDVCLLGIFGLITKNYVVASFHDGSSVLEGCGISGWILRSLSAVILLGSCQKDYFQQHLSPAKIFMIPHGVDTNFFVPASNSSIKRSDETHKTLVLTVGGHTRDFNTLAVAFGIVRKRIPSVRIVAVGANTGNKGPKLPAEGIEHMSGITDDELRSLYQSASVVVLAFDYAVANNAILEALACGTPVVATDIGSVREYLLPTGGVLTPPGDGCAMAEAVINIIALRQNEDKISLEARLNAEKFSLEKVSFELAKCYKSIAFDERGGC